MISTSVTRRRGTELVLAVALAVLSTSLPIAASVSAAGPAEATGQSSLAIRGDDFVPLTAEQLDLVNAKKAVAAQVAANIPTGSASCPLVGVQMSPTASCPPSGALPVYPRQQVKYYYCGPAAVQVVSNYAWGIRDGSTSHFTQQYISSTWTNTDNDGQTYVWRVRLGLNGATAGHVPADFIYAEDQPKGGSDWHVKLRADISTYAMPMVAGVAPHDPDASFYLTSWPNARQAGHYIVVSGWNGIWDGTPTRTPTVTFKDGSAGYGGGTGTFFDPASDVYYTITKKNPLHAPNWVVW